MLRWFTNLWSFYGSQVKLMSPGKSFPNTLTGEVSLTVPSLLSPTSLPERPHFQCHPAAVTFENCQSPCEQAPWGQGPCLASLQNTANSTQWLYHLPPEFVFSLMTVFYCHSFPMSWALPWYTHAFCNFLCCSDLQMRKLSLRQKPIRMKEIKVCEHTPSHAHPPLTSVLWSSVPSSKSRGKSSILSSWLWNTCSQLHVILHPAGSKSSSHSEHGPLIPLTTFISKAKIYETRLSTLLCHETLWPWEL